MKMKIGCGTLTYIRRQLLDHIGYLKASKDGLANVDIHVEKYQAIVKLIEETIDSLEYI